MDEKMLDQNSAVLNYEELLARCMGNVDFVERVLDKFQCSFGQDLDNLEAALDSEDAEIVTTVAHRLKGASASVAAPGLRDGATEVEDLGRADRLAEARLHAGQLRDEWSRFLDHVAAATGCV